MGQAKRRAAEIAELKTKKTLLLGQMPKINWDDVNKGYEPFAAMLKSGGFDWQSMSRAGFMCNFVFIVGSQDDPKVVKQHAFSMAPGALNANGSNPVEFSIIAGIYDGIAKVRREMKAQLPTKMDVQMVAVVNNEINVVYSA